MQKKRTAPTKKGLVIFMQMRDSPMISDWQKKLKLLFLAENGLSNTHK